MFLFLSDKLNSEFDRYADFEDFVYRFIYGALSSGETIVRSPRLRADFLLPCGCTRLGFDPNTAIEVITVLQFDTIKRYLSHWVREDYSGRYNYVIVYGESSIPDEKNKQYEGVAVISFDDLQKREPSVTPSQEISKEWREERERILINAQRDSVSGKVSLFLGAGVSKSANLPLWSELLERLILKLNNLGVALDYSKISKDADNSYLIIGRALRHSFGSKERFIQVVRDALYQTPSDPGKLVETISTIIANNDNIEKVITYNFDDVLEQKMIKKYCSITNDNRIDPGTFPIYHVHGFIPESKSSLDNPSSIVFSEEAYHEVYKESYHWSNIEQLHALANTTCFFIGLSMKDPNIRRLLDVAQERDRDRYHYAFLYRREFKAPDMVDKLLNELRVKVIWFWSLHQLPELLKKVFA